MTIGLVGKYIDLPDAYLSVVESLRHGGAANKAKVDIRWIPAEEVDGLLAESHLDGLHGILVARWVRHPRRRREDPGYPSCQGAIHTIPRTMPRSAMCGHRVCPQCPWDRRCPQHRIRSDDAKPRYRSDA